MHSCGPPFMSELPESGRVEDRQTHAAPDADDAFALQKREIAANRFKRQAEMIGDFRTGKPAS